MEKDELFDIIRVYHVVVDFRLELEDSVVESSFDCFGLNIV